jgi:serine/threonine protein kinase
MKRTEKATFTADIYSFGMCILEAVSGKHPWGMRFPDNVVKYYVLQQHKLPMRRENCSDEMYRLVERLCCFEPRQISVVIDELKLLVPRSTPR